MPPSEIAARLAALDATPTPLAARLDDGPPLGARAVVLPSAFNPPTIAHLHLLEVARGAASADSAIALLTTRNVAKEVFGADLAHRVGMLLALRSTQPHLAVMAANVARIADQGVALRGAFPGVEFDFVMGYDTLVRLFQSTYYTDMPAELAAFFAHHRVVATNRAEATVDVVRALLDEPYVRPFADRIIVAAADEHPASLSSTQAREEVRRREGTAAVPAPVLEYIHEHGLYIEG